LNQLADCCQIPLQHKSDDATDNFRNETLPVNSIAPDLPKNVFAQLNAMTYDDSTYRSIPTMEKHLEWAETLPTPSTTDVLPDWLENAAERLAADPETIISQAEIALEKWLTRKHELATQWNQERQQLPSHISMTLGEDKNLPLLREIAQATVHDNPDASNFVRDLATGLPYVGDLPFTGTTEQVPHEGPPPNPDELLQQAMDYRNQDAINRTMRSNTESEVSAGLLAKTLKDVHRNFCFETEVHTDQRRLLSPRFPKDEGYRASGERKIRPCKRFRLCIFIFL
jgi:hypothetical protein